MQQPSSRIQKVQTPIIPRVADLVLANPGTVSLGQGVVFYDPPDTVADALNRFGLESKNHRYQAVEGIDPLRAAIMQKTGRENRITGKGLEAVVTAGSNMGFLNALLAICDPGDEIVLLKPWYFNHEMAIRLIDCVPVGVDTDADYQPDLKAIEAAISPRTRAVVTISPNNPTGAVYAAGVLEEINRMCEAHGIFHISDEAYEYFVYDDARHYSPASREGASGHTISLFSTSKSYSLASWRIGYMLVPDYLFASIRKIQDTNVICPPVISQYAALACLETGVDFVKPMIEQLGQVRSHFIAGLRSLPGVSLGSPKGAFYGFMHLADAGLSDMQVVERLITEHRVAIIPGSAFGYEQGCYLRAAYGALEPETALHGIDRLVNGLSRILAG